MKALKKALATTLSGIMLFGLVACNGGTSNTSDAAKETGGSEAQTDAGESQKTDAAETDADKTEADTSKEAGSGEAVKLTVWSPSDDVADASGAWLIKEAESFEAENPQWDLTFEYGEAGEGEARDKVLKDVQAAADVYMYANDQINDLIAGNALARLGGEAEAYVKETNDPSLVESVSVDGKIYGIPFTTNTWFMYYDTSVFSEDDIKSLDTMLEKGKVAFPLKDSWYLASFYLANGGTMFGDGKDNEAGINFGGEAGAQVTEYLVDLVANKNFVVDGDGLGKTGLKDKSVNAVFSGSWDFLEIKEALGENLGIAQLPTAKIGGSDKQLLSFGGTKVIGVNPNAKNMEVAVAFAKWITRPEAQQSKYDLRNIIPTHMELLKDPKMQEDALVLAQNNTMTNTSFLQPFVPNMGAYWEPATNFGTAIANGEVTKDNAAERTEEFNNQLNSSGVN